MQSLLRLVSICHLFLLSSHICQVSSALAHTAIRSIQKAIPSPAVFTISYDPRYTTLRVYLDDDVIREVKSFGLKAAGIDGNTADIGEGGIKGVKPADVLADKEVWIGVMACSPVGPKEEEKSALATFKHFETCEGTRSGE